MIAIEIESPFAMALPGEEFSCTGLAITVHPEPTRDDFGNTLVDANGKPAFRLGFRFGGGIDQDNMKSPAGYPDRGIYVTQIQPDSPAAKGGLQLHDKILQFEGYDFTMVTHSQAQKMIEKKSQKKPALGFIVYRAGLGQQAQQSKML